MKHQLSPKAAELVSVLCALKKDGQKVYLVGGAVRDLLLDIPVHDLDFVCNFSSDELARALRKRLRGAAFSLDDERAFNRVILKSEDGNEQFVDIAEYIGDDLETDLRRRDFTINAIAMDIEDLGALIDPLGGASDLEEGILRQCSPSSFADDPLRVLRAYRMMKRYNLEIAFETLSALRVAIKGLGGVSAERLREELFKILDLHGRSESLRWLWQNGVLGALFSCVPVYEGVLQSSSDMVVEKKLAHVHRLELIFDQLVAGEEQNEGGAGLRRVMQILHPWQTQLLDEVRRALTPGRALSTLLYMAALLLDPLPVHLRNQEYGNDRSLDISLAEPPSSVKTVVSTYRLSNPEADYLNRLEEAFRSDMIFAGLQNVFNLEQKFVLLKTLKETIPGFVLLALAFLSSAPEDLLGETAFSNALENLGQVLSLWYERGDEIMKPKLIMDGNEVMAYSAIKAGPLLGQLLAQLEKEQFLGDIQTREGAERFVDEWLENHAHLGKEA